MNIKSDVQLDCKGLSCPMPIVRTKKAMDELKPGQILEIHATDSGLVRDIPAWAENAGHQLVKQNEADGVCPFRKILFGQAFCQNVAKGAGKVGDFQDELWRIGCQIHEIHHEKEKHR